MDPATMMAASMVLGKAVTPAPAGPSSADSIFDTKIAFDNSGWNVAFGGSDIKSAAEKTTDQAGAAGAGAGGNRELMVYGLIFVGMILVWKIAKKS